MSKISAPKGTVDLLPADSWKWQTVEKIARDISALYHFAEIRTPIFEHTELFHRGVGEASDIVNKEMYTFEDRGARSITLRPEGTAGVVRAMIESGALNDQGARAKVFYIGPNFRFERPQAGRLRQHHQFGAEAFGVAEPDQDVECILLQMDFYRRCGVKDLELQINSLGDRESKERYRDALVAYLTPKTAQLSQDSQRRLSQNPLRILDSKDPRDQEACQGAPPAGESLSDKSRAHFERVQLLLTEALGGKGRGDTETRGRGDEANDPLSASLCPSVTASSSHPLSASPRPGVPESSSHPLSASPCPSVPASSHRPAFRVNANLVRGFDYYTETLWEVTAGGLGAQNAIGGGGRYDNLVEQLGGRPTPGVGFGSGLERLLLALEGQGVALPQPPNKLVWLVSHGDAARAENWNLLLELRAAGVTCDMDASNRSVKGQFKLADREKAAFCIVIGESELQNRQAVLKDLKTGEQTLVSRDEIVMRLL